ncbi:DUF3267 domain-containing protein [Riemerella anatipestifer]|nr:DUF3267 domain-containing protein [Riemerella anatipestifer]
MNELENYIKEKKTIDLVEANIYAILGIIPIAILYFVPFYILWQEKFTLDYLKVSLKESNFISNSYPIAFIIFIAIIIGIILHELIHGLTWSIFTKNGFKSMKFGILLKMLTPYCHCKEPLKVKQYIIGAIMPSIILGLLPAILAIILGNIILLVFGTFFTIAAIGDFMIINLLKSENKDSYVLDHPSEAGCFIFREK